MDIVDQFIEKFNEVKEMGFVHSRRSHNTGIGKTFEDLIGVDENNKSHPDFGNIEVKSQRNYTSSYITLFTKSPTNPPGVNRVLRDNYGIASSKHPDLMKLHTSMFTHFNRCYDRWGFRLYPDDTNNRLHIQVKNLLTDEMEDIDVWYDYDVLRQIIEKKLHILAFVQAETRTSNGWEEFHFTHCTICYKCEFDVFMNLIKNDMIMYDIRIGSYKSGKNFGKPHDHGSGFRIRKENLPKAFQRIETI